MSKEVDQKVVQMQFDNRQFEKATSQSMSTIDKLKEKLNFKDTAKNMDALDKSISKVDFSHLTSGAEAVTAKFSSLQVVGMTALSNLTNSALNAGKQFTKSLTIDPVKTGFDEYELKMNSVRTIMASTGESIETVNEYLEELNKYADETIYSYSDMTDNVGKFTNSGVQLEDAVIAMKGISNEAALAGASSNEASRAMYNFAQSMSMGYVALQDWKSIIYANMATDEFKLHLLDTAKAMGTVEEVAEDLYSTGSQELSMQGMFYDGLKDEWLTADVLVETLRQYGDETTEIGKKAYQAAKEVSTISKMFDTLKEAAQSGWAATWELIIGDKDQATETLTKISDKIGDIVKGIAAFRNNKLAKALSSPYKDLIKTVTPVTKVIGNVTKKVDDYGKLVDKIIYGDYGNGQERVNKLTKAGYDYAHAQNLVNEKLGISLRLATNYGKTQTKTGKTITYTVDQLAKMSDAQLKSVGYTADQTKALRKLSKAAESAGKPLSQFMKEVDKTDGRTLLIESFANIWRNIETIFKAVKKAWDDVFTPSSESALYNLIAGFNNFTKKLIITEKQSENITKVFKVLFSVIGTVTSFVKGAFTFAFKLIGDVLGKANFSVGDLTDKIANGLTKLRQWVKEHDIWAKAAKVVADAITKTVTAVRDFIKQIMELPQVKSTIDKFAKEFKNRITTIKNLFNGELDVTDVDLLSGFTEGLKKNGPKIFDTIIGIAKGIIETFKNILGIHSPSVVFMAIGALCIAGLIIGLISKLSSLDGTTSQIGSDIITGIQNGFEGSTAKLSDIAKTIVDKVKGVLEKINIGEIFASAILAGSLVVVNKLGGVMESLVKVVELPAKGLGKMLGGIGDAASAFGKKMKAGNFKNIGKGILDMAIAIGILVAAIYVLVKLDDAGKVWGAIAQIGALAGILLLLSVVSKKISETANIKDVAKSVLALIPIAAAIFILSAALNKLAQIDNKDVPKVLIMLVVIVGGLIALMYAIGTFVKGQAAKNIDKAGYTILKIAVAFGLLVNVIKTIAGIDPKDLVVGLFTLTYFTALVVALIAASTLAGKNAEKAGKMILSIAGAFLAMGLVVRLLAGLDKEQLSIGLKALKMFTKIIVALILVSSYATNDVKSLGKMFLGIGVALIAMALAVKILSGISVGGILKGIVVIGLVLTMFTVLVYVSKYAGDNAMKAGVMIGLMSIALIAIAGAIFIITQIAKSDAGALILATTVILLILGMFGALIAATSLVKGAKSTITALMVAVLTLSLVLVALTILAKNDPNSMMQAVASMAIIMLLLVALMATTALLEKADTKKMLPMFLMFVGILLVVAGVLIAINKCSSGSSSAMANAVALTIVLLAATAVLAILSKLGSSISKNGKDILTAVGLLAAIFASLLLVVLSLWLLRNVDNAVQSAVALTTLLLAASVVLIVLTAVGSIIASSGGMAGGGLLAALGGLAAIFASLLIVVGVIFLLSIIDKSMEILESLTKFMMVMVAMLVVLAIVGPLAVIGIGAMYGLISLMVVIGTLATALGALNTLFNGGLEKLINEGLPLLITLASGIGKMIGAFIAGIAVSVASSLPIIGACVSAFMIALQPFIDGVKKVDKSLVEKVKTLSASILLLTATSFISGLLSLGGIGLVALGLQLSGFMLGAYYFVSQAKKIDANAMKGVEILTEVIKKLTETSLLNTIGKFLNLGKSPLTSMTNDLAKVGTNIRKFIEKLGDLSMSQILSVTAAAKIIQAVGNITTKTKPKTLKEIGDSLPDLASNIHDYVVNLGGFNENSYKIVSWSASALKALATAATKIPAQGGVFSKIFGDDGIEKFGSLMPDFATNLHDYAVNLGGFNKNSLTVISWSTKAIGAIAEVAGKLPAQDGVFKRLFGDGGISSFGSKLPALAMHLVKYCATLYNNKFSKNSLTLITWSTKALTAIADSTTALSKIKAKNMGEVSSGLPSLATNLHDYAANLGGFNDNSVKLVNLSSTALGYICDAAKNISGTDNVLDDDFIDFSYKMATVATNLSNYVKNLPGFTEDSLNIVKWSSEALVALCNAATKVPSQGGGLSALFGDNGITTFSSKLPTFATDLKAFADNMGVFDETTLMSTEIAGEMLGTLATAAKKVSNEDSLWTRIFGTNSLSSFSSELGPLGEGLNAFATSLTDMGEEKLSAVNTASAIITAVAALSKVEQKAIKQKMGAIGDGMKDFGSKIKDFFANTGNVNPEKANSIAEAVKSITGITEKVQAKDFNTVSTSLDTLVTSMKTASNIGEEASAPFVKAVNGVANLSIKTLLETFEDSYDSMRLAGLRCILYFRNGLQNGNGKVASICTSIVEHAIKEIELYSSSNSTSFYKAGVYLAEGLINGINDKMADVEAAAKKLGEKAVTAELKGQKSESPSKATIKAGHYLGDGLIIGIKDMFKPVSNVGNKLGNTVANSITSSLAAIGYLADSGIEIKPLISPVIDMSNAVDGIEMLNGVLGMGSNMRLAANVSTIDRRMQQRNQNGEIVSAIKDLKDNTQPTVNNTYNVNGVTYDDGSNVSDAVDVLIRAARVSRRS